jgi:serine protease Do
MRRVAAVVVGALVVAAVLVGLARREVRAGAPVDALADLERRQSELFERLGPAVAFISSGSGFGSGFFVGDTGLILTNAHVTGSAPSVRVVLSDGRSLPGSVVKRGPGALDLALVKVDGPKPPGPRLHPAPELRVGAWVASVGHGRGGIWSFNTGMVSNIYPQGTDRPVFQTQIPLNPGSSGGPVVDRLGRVVGIVTAGLTNSNSINFAIRSEVALKAFPELASACDCLVITAPAGVPVFVNGRMAGVGPRVLFPAEARSYEVFAVVNGVMRKQRLRFPEKRLVELK